MTLGVSEPTPDSKPTLPLAQAFELLLPLLSDRKNWGGHWMEGYESLTLSTANFTPHNGEPNPFEAICGLLVSDAGHLKRMLEKRLNLVGALNVSFNHTPDKTIVLSASEVDIENSKIRLSPATQIATSQADDLTEIRARINEVRKHGGYGVGGG